MKEGKVTRIRNILLSSIGLRLTDKAAKFSEKDINARILTPFCTMDIAYGIWQDTLKDIEPKGELKAISDVIKRIWSTKIYGKKSFFYKKMNQDDIYTLSEYSDMLNENIKKDLFYMNMRIQAKCMALEKDRRCAYVNLLLIAHLLSTASESLKAEWGVNYKFLEQLNQQLDRFTTIYVKGYEKETSFSLLGDKELLKMSENMYRKIISFDYAS